MCVWVLVTCYTMALAHVALLLLKISSATNHFDNLNATLILKKESSKIRLYEQAIQVDKFFIRNNIEINCVHIPRNLNKFVDSMSKMIDFEDYSVTDSFSYSFL